MKRNEENRFNLKLFSAKKIQKTFFKIYNAVSRNNFKETLKYKVKSLRHTKRRFRARRFGRISRRYVPARAGVPALIDDR